MTTVAASGSLSHGTLLVMLGGCLILGLASGFATWRAWHREKVYEPRSPYARRSQDEHMRAVPAATVTFVLWGLLCVVDLIWGQHASGARVAIGVFGFGGLAAGVVGMSAGMTGHPIWAVPPALRPRGRGERPHVFDGES